MNQTQENIPRRIRRHPRDRTCVKTIIRSDKQIILFTHQKCHGRALRPRFETVFGPTEQREIIVFTFFPSSLFIRPHAHGQGRVTSSCNVRFRGTGRVEPVAFPPPGIRISLLYTCILHIHVVRAFVKTYAHALYTAEFIAQVGNPHENRWVLCNVETVLTRCLGPPRG